MMVFAIVPNVNQPHTVFATGEKNQDNTCLGTDKIAPPEEPTSKDSPWSGSYVYYGNYEGEPIKFRVLRKDSSVLLDSDVCLFGAKFNQSSDEEQYIYDYSSLKDIVTEKVGDGYFLLNQNQITNPAYGYSPDNDDMSVANHIKKYHGSGASYWLDDGVRGGFSGGGDMLKPMGRIVDQYGCIWTTPLTSTRGIAPAIYIDKSSILFSTLLSGNFNTVGSEYKFTIIDPKLSIEILSNEKVEVSGTTVSIPYWISGDNVGTANRVSILIKNNLQGEPISYALFKVVHITRRTLEVIHIHESHSHVCLTQVKRFVIARKHAKRSGMFFHKALVVPILVFVFGIWIRESKRQQLETFFVFGILELLLKGIINTPVYIEPVGADMG